MSNNVVRIAPYQVKKGKLVLLCPICGRALDSLQFKNATGVRCLMLNNQHVHMAVYSTPPPPPPTGRPA